MAKIEEAIVKFLIDNGTFYASLLSQMHRQVDTKTPTVSVEMKNGRITMRHNPEFLDPRSMKDTKAILEHECLHIVMEHHGRAKGKEFDKWKVACDLAINQLLKYVPEDGLTVDKVFGEDMNKLHVQTMEKAEYYYDMIKKSKQAQQNIKDMMGKGQCGCGDDIKPSEGDNIDPELSKELIKQMVGEAAKAAKGQGHVPHFLDQYIEELFKISKVSWRTLLRRFVSNSIKTGTRPSWKKPSRRYGDTQKGRTPDRTIALTIVIDTSGSIDDEVLKQFMGEVKAIQSCYKSDITVIECDAQVHRHYKLRRFQALDRKVMGRGGTDFRPPFEYVKKKGIRTDAMIYFTDLEGTFPDRRPSIPVMWGYYNAWGMQRNPRVPFGLVVPIENEEKSK